MVCLEDGGDGVPEVVGTGQSISGGVEEEVSGSGLIGQRRGNRLGGRNSPRNYDGPGMRVGVKSSNLT